MTAQCRTKRKDPNRSWFRSFGAGNGNRTTVFIHHRCKNQMFLLKAHRFFWKGLHLFAGPFYFLQKYVGPKVGPSGANWVAVWAEVPIWPPNALPARTVWGWGLLLTRGPS
jgi:hypothetical protein